VIIYLESHHKVTQAQLALLKVAYPGADVEELRLVSRVTVELIYAATELLFDESPLSAEAVSQLVAAMVASYRGRLRRPRGKSERKTGGPGKVATSSARDRRGG
jgi:hypothetical protein